MLLSTSSLKNFSNLKSQELNSLTIRRLQRKLNIEAHLKKKKFTHACAEKVLQLALSV